MNLIIKIVNKLTCYFNTNYICNAFDLEANTSNPANCHSPSSCPFSVRKDIKPIVLQALGFFSVTLDRAYQVISLLILQVGKQNGKEVLA